jgi:iron complex transport system permease protein
MTDVRDRVVSRSKIGIEGYIAHSKRKSLFLVALLGLLIVISIAVLKIDVGSISFSELLRVIFDKGNALNDKADVILIWNLYLPRIVSGLLAGFALGIAGTVMQCVLKNPLGSPYTLGISNAAAFGASLGIVALGGGIIVGQSHASIVINNPYLVTISAFSWSLIATGIIILLVKVTKVSPETMVLAGVALSSIFSAGISLLQYVYNDYALSTIVFWQFGSLGKASWDELTIIAVVSLGTIVYFLWKRWDYNALDAGDDVAQSLGIDVSRLRLVTLFLSALVTSIIVSFMGIIAFIGLLGPHIVRLFIGNDHRYVLPGSMILGAMILLISDCIGQNLLTYTLPVGIITSFLGGPLFLYLLIRGYRSKKVSE